MPAIHRGVPVPIFFCEAPSAVWKPVVGVESCTLQNTRDCQCDPFPTFAMPSELLPTCRGELVILRVSIVLTSRPLGLHLAILFETVQRGEQRSRIYLKCLMRQR